MNSVVSLFVLYARSIGRICNHHAAGQAIVAGDVRQPFQTCQRRFHIVQSVGRLRDLVAECLGCEVCAGPKRGVAAVRVSHDLVARRR